jgi:hypothetical protein
MKTFSWWGLVAAILALFAGWLGSGIRPPAEPLPRIALAAVASAAFFAVLTLFVLPGLKPVWLSPQIAAAFEKAKPCPNSRLIATGYAEPSLVFLAGTNTLLVGPEDAAKALAADRCAVAVPRGSVYEGAARRPSERRRGSDGARRQLFQGDGAASDPVPRQAIARATPHRSRAPAFR